MKPAPISTQRRRELASYRSPPISFAMLASLDERLTRLERSTHRLRRGDFMPWLRLQRKVLRAVGPSAAKSKQPNEALLTTEAAAVAFRHLSNIARTKIF